MRESRWIRKLFMGLVAWLAIGIASTRLSVDDGLARLSGREATIAAEALSTAHTVCLDTLLKRLLVQRMQVVYVKLFDDHESGEVPDKLSAYEVLVRTYTVFEIALGTVRVGADGKVRCET